MFSFFVCDDTLRRHNNKAGYMATPVACGWAGAVFELPECLGRSSEAKDRKKTKQNKKSKV